MSRRLFGQRFVAAVIIVAGYLVSASVLPAPMMAQQPDELTRKVKFKVSPTYPDVAKRLSITGVVKIAVVVSPNGNLKSSKVVGGHPLLVNAALDALKKWKFEAAAEESSGIVEFKFEPQQ